METGQPAKDIVFLFGAGASCGAGGIIPEAPPLGAQLYQRLERSYPGSWGNLPSNIREALRNDFEDGMRDIYEQFGTAIPGLMREMAVYFVQFRPAGQSGLYARLINDLSRMGLINQTVFSTLNYECVLELSLVDQGHGIDYFDTDNGGTAVWKLHGSCNMFSQGIKAGAGISYGTGVIWEGGIEAFLDSNRVIEICLVETGLAPVMCLYMQGKPLSISPSVIQERQKAWKDLIASAKLVVSVGVRPINADEHLWEPLASTPATFCFVGSQSALEDWCGARGDSPTEYLGRRFHEAYPEIIRRLPTNEADPV